MDQKTPDFFEEQEYLEQTKAVLKQALMEEKGAIEAQGESLLEVKKEWWENSRMGKFLDANQYLESIRMKASTQYATMQRIHQYEASLQTPYFARVDFKEDGYPMDKVYIGLHSVTDEETFETYVYDWRAPIASIFYRYEPGPASFAAPSGTISGEITLKRQYEIKDGELQFFFDSSINIQDEILRSVLSQNASPKMKNIVETIQRQQDEIIRDTEHDLLMVQGVAGSGKTSVALHRIAYLMYQGMNHSLSSQNIVILSPNALFGRYIANVLPELGEESIMSVTFEELFRRNLAWEGGLETKNDYLEVLTSSMEEEDKQFLRDSASFFASPALCTVLDRYLKYIKNTIPFEDLYYNNKLLMTKQDMFDFLYSSNRTVSMEKSLQLVAARLWDAIHEERKNRLDYLVHFYRPMNEHRYDYRTFARYTSIREITRLKHHIQSFTTLDYPKLFLNLLKDKELFLRMAQNVALPKNWEEMLSVASGAIAQGKLDYGTSLALFYLKTGLSGNSYPNIRQVVVDEAQDYFPLHFRLLTNLFPNARFTVLGDINQTIEKDASPALYDEIAAVMGKKSPLLLTMNKGFRCSWEISKFSEHFLDTPYPVEAFQRHGKEPEIHRASNQKDLAQQIAAAVHNCQTDGLSSIAIICKTMERAKAVHKQIKGFVDGKVITDHSSAISGVSILPLYLAKGLEFDAAIIDEVNAENYHSKFDKKLLYVCTTRPLHRLELFYTGKPSKYIKELIS